MSRKKKSSDVSTDIFSEMFFPANGLAVQTFMHRCAQTDIDR